MTLSSRESDLLTCALLHALFGRSYFLLYVHLWVFTGEELLAMSQLRSSFFRSLYFIACLTFINRVTSFLEGLILVELPEPISLIFFRVFLSLSRQLHHGILLYLQIP
jgi:hypothetical protein